MNRIKKAWKRGYAEGRWYRNRGYPMPQNLNQISPYSSFWPGVQCLIAWKDGMKMAFSVNPSTHEHRWSYGITSKGAK
jgi:hypothetical protein